MIAVILAVSIGAGYIGAAVVARHRAQAAADLAALAAATLLPRGTTAACAAATTLARRMATDLTRCDAHDLDMVVGVEAPVGLAGWGMSRARATARAGPAQP